MPRGSVEQQDIDAVNSRLDRIIELLDELLKDRYVVTGHEAIEIVHQDRGDNAT